jgi:hypothetical protein
MFACDEPGTTAEPSIWKSCVTYGVKLKGSISTRTMSSGERGLTR